MRRPQKFGPSSTLFLTLHKCKMHQIWIASWEYLNFVEKNRNLSSTTPHCTVQYDFCITDVFFRLLQLLYNYFMLPLEFWFWCDKNDMIVNFPELWPNSCNAKKKFGYIFAKKTSISSTSTSKIEIKFWYIDMAFSYLCESLWHQRLIFLDLYSVLFLLIYR